MSKSRGKGIAFLRKLEKLSGWIVDPSLVMLTVVLSLIITSSSVPLTSFRLKTVAIELLDHVLQTGSSQEIWLTTSSMVTSGGIIS